MKAAKSYAKYISNSPGLEPDGINPAGTGRRVVAPKEDPAIKRAEQAAEMAMRVFGDPEKAASTVLEVGEG